MPRMIESEIREAWHFATDDEARRYVAERERDMLAEDYVLVWTLEHVPGAWEVRMTFTHDPLAAEQDRNDVSLDELRRLRALYEGEKAAGLHKSREEYEAELRDAGRGHLIRRD